MRLAPLIPLGLLALGALLAQAVQLGRAPGNASAKLSIERAQVASTLAAGRASFAAARLELTDTFSEATAVRGQLHLANAAYRFAAERLVRAPHSAGAALRGNVFIAHGDRILRSAQVTLDPEGLLKGSSVTMESGRLFATADRFALRGDELELSGAVNFQRQ